ncbi:MAG: hypothetical protein KatS3mg028_1693 [Bacteroidia bacterium]|jgi:hypothetical protein|nr:MAG: hypothetical protein KatS3mg028_1693 [Bacteroidia bacterium]
MEKGVIDGIEIENCHIIFSVFLFAFRGEIYRMKARMCFKNFFMNIILLNYQTNQVVIGGFYRWLALSAILL